MESFCAERLSKLQIYDREYLKYTKCLCRGIEVLVSNKPEELVRQVLIYYLINESGLSPNEVDVKAEYNNLDIAILRHILDDDFRPFQPPLVIIEVKREEANLLSHENQLHAYLRENRTNTGVLFNGSDIIAYENYLSDLPIQRQFKSLDDFRDLITRAIDQDKNYSIAFQRAREGDLNSFIELANKYGRHTLHKFTFVLKSSPTPITGCCFRIEERICYDLYGKYGRKARFSFHRDEFDKLLSVVY